MTSVQQLEIFQVINLTASVSCFLFRDKLGTVCSEHFPYRCVCMASEVVIHLFK